MRGHPAPSRKQGQKVAACLGVSPASSSSPNVGNGQGNVVEVCGTLTARSVTSFGAPEVDGGMYFPVPTKNSSGFETGPSGGRFTDLAPTLDTRCKDGPMRNQLGMGVLTDVKGPQAYSIMPMNSGKDYKARPVDVAQPIMAAGPTGGNQGGDVIVQAVNTSDGYPRLDDIAGTLNCENTTGRGSAQRVDVFVQAFGFDAYNNDVTSDVSKTVDTGQDYHHVPNVLQYSTMAFGVNEQPYTGHCLRSGASRADKHESTTYVVASAVRRLTPTECERLQGFPDGYTAIPWKNKAADQCPDGPRYKALGNSMAVPVMRWIGERIQKVEAGEYLNEPI
jgi:DNA (cytosine-5)-methyltransferase 1